MCFMNGFVKKKVFSEKKCLCCIKMYNGLKLSLEVDVLFRFWPGPMRSTANFVVADKKGEANQPGTGLCIRFDRMALSTWFQPLTYDLMVNLPGLIIMHHSAGSRDYEPNTYGALTRFICLN